MTQGSDYFVTPVALDRDMFMRRLIASLGHLNEGILGSDVAGAYIMNVGLSMGAAIEAEYKRFWNIDRQFTVDEYTHVIIDLKQKIHGNFSLVSKGPQEVVVRTTSCPFDELVQQSPSLCFMTSSVFGGIAARNFGYAKVVLHKRIALGDPGCYVRIYLQRTPEAEAAIGREYVPDVDRANPDIAEQLRLMDSVRRLRLQLHETSTRWDELVRGAAEAICVITPDGKIGFANARWRELLGVEGDELVGAALEQVVHPNDRRRFVELMVTALNGQRVIGQIQRLQHRDTTWRDVRMSVTPMRDDAGTIIGTLALLYDVTEELDTQRLKDEFMSTASHELRTPITTIRGITGLLLRRIERNVAIRPEDLSKHLATIQQEADRLAVLGTDLLDITRLQQGRLRLRQERHNLVDIVAACVRRQQALLEPEVSHVITMKQSVANVVVSIEAGRIEQVVMNLLENATKYAPSDTKITVMVDVRDDEAVVRVVDQGIGIPAQDLKRIFTPFFRASNAPSLNFMGLGLSLYFCKAIAEAHGGDLALESTEGQGTTAILTLPLFTPALLDS